MAKTWKCFIGWHQWVRRPKDDDPNHKMCARCHKKRNMAVGMWGASGGGYG